VREGLYGGVFGGLIEVERADEDFSVYIYDEGQGGCCDDLYQ
jgi:hypothetical protein